MPDDACVCFLLVAAVAALFPVHLGAFHGPRGPVGDGRAGAARFGGRVVGQHYLDILVVSFLTFACCRPCTQSHRKANRDALRMLDDANLVYRYTRLGLNERYGSTKVEQVRGGLAFIFIFRLLVTVTVGAHCHCHRQHYRRRRSSTRPWSSLKRCV